jgi:hypothetical protein
MALLEGICFHKFFSHADERDHAGIANTENPSFSRENILIQMTSHNSKEIPFQK